MPGKHQGSFVGAWLPAELSAWVDDEVARRGGGRGVKSQLLTEILEAARAGRIVPVKCPGCDYADTIALVDGGWRCANCGEQG